MKLSNLPFLSRILWGLIYCLPLLLTQCGQPVCAMGFGQCGIPERKNESTTDTTKKLSLSVGDANITASETVTFNVSGGVPPYKYDITKGSGELSPKDIYTKDTAGTYTPPTSVEAEGLEVKIRVTDSATPTAETDSVLILVKTTAK